MSIIFAAVLIGIPIYALGNAIRDSAIIIASAIRGGGNG